MNLAVMSDLHVGLAARSKDLCPEPPANPRKDRDRYNRKIENDYRQKFVEFVRQPHRLHKSNSGESTYRRVKANRGAAGVDGESIAEFDRDLEKNLYKLWTRMSSGSYFPPPVRTVENPKDSGGT